MLIHVLRLRGDRSRLSPVAVALVGGNAYRLTVQMIRSVTQGKPHHRTPRRPLTCCIRAGCRSRPQLQPTKQPMCKDAKCAGELLQESTILTPVLLFSKAVKLRMQLAVPYAPMGEVIWPGNAGDSPQPAVSPFLTDDWGHPHHLPSATAWGVFVVVGSRRNARMDS